MAFFEYVPEEQLAPEAKEYIEVTKKRLRSDRLAPMYYAMAKYPRLLKAFVQAFEDLVPVPNRFGTAQFIASMLIAHAKGWSSMLQRKSGFLVENWLGRRCPG